MSDLTELFSRDPLELTRENIDEIITHMREKRHLFNAAPKPKAKAKTKKLTDAQAAALKLDLDLKL